MSQNHLDLAMKAMNHPKALEILDFIHRLGEKDLNTSFPTVVTPNTDSDTNLPRLSELELHGVNTSSPQLVQVVSQYPERLSSAINAWLKWVSHTEVEYPTLSLIKAIEQNWQT